MFVSASALDGKGKLLAVTKITDSWKPRHGAWAGLPRTVRIVFDHKDLGSLTAEALQQVAAHEIGHALGLGVAWEGRDLIRKEAEQHVFKGPETIREYGQLIDAGPTMVPVDYHGGSHGAHWREEFFPTELMSTKLDDGFQAISILTLASLRDLGYEVKIDAADAFTLEKKKR